MRKKKILYVPLDERPCNYDFPNFLSSGSAFSLERPGRELMGLKKEPGEAERIWEWLFEHVKDADGAILSLDTLIYGGIVPSRLHEMTIEECNNRLQRIRKLKELNPQLQIYAFHLIMRCPSYSSHDEEPDYYEQWGREIFRQGFIRHKIEIGIATEEERKELQAIEAVLPEAVVKDYKNRRSVNREMNKQAIELVQGNMIDFMIIPQDDSAPYGLTAIDQQYVREYIEALGLQLCVYMYPGADEIGCTLLARMINQYLGRKPLIYPRFSSIEGPFITPTYEDRDLLETIKYQVMAAGGLLCTSCTEADLVLCVNTPGDRMMEACAQNDRGIGYNVFRTIIELVETADYIVHYLKKPCMIADVAFINGGDLELLQLLRDKKLLFKLAAYAGWNTSSNTLGTCIAQGMLYSVYGNTQSHLDFLSLRYVEDAGYCSFVRTYMCKNELPHLGSGFTYFSIDGPRGKVAGRVKVLLNDFIELHINDGEYEVKIDDCYMPWSRMFEVGLKTHAVKLEK
ncbi:DUF4127 family protein [Paenibacillus larvae]